MKKLFVVFSLLSLLWCNFVFAKESLYACIASKKPDLIASGAAEKMCMKKIRPGTDLNDATWYYEAVLVECNKKGKGEQYCNDIGFKANDAHDALEAAEYQKTLQHSTQPVK